MEDGGRTIHSGLKMRDPMRPKGCVFSDPNCMVEEDSQCDRQRVVYKITCRTCLEIIITEDTHNYIGLTRTTVHQRMLGHLRSQAKRQSHSPLHRHDTEHHGGNPQLYSTSIVASEKKIIRLYCNEALQIEKQDNKYSMNERNEGGRGGVVIISATRVTH